MKHSELRLCLAEENHSQRFFFAINDRNATAMIKTTPKTTPMAILVTSCDVEVNTG